ncbi:hypothetical protein G647_06889 [Cladophialophora carrionii CBS 160.54]|uniref:DUF676 domain-containing protein n=1 Tax=Cladophialophora carrionii CBS 160.54 TaxID=1279043 RepID=V9D920_9EURO|nr:uncharacterized protein G647_06889 [Cladophialophora carrionii CBS 160.54]ETI22813.1 hypothetical protein G647_06889 [Cladophialophora carrionii CBS 160.54]
MAAQTSTPLPYTANPLLLMFNDVLLFLQITLTWPITAGLLSIVLPLLPGKSGPLDELAWTGPNLWALLQHFILILAQILFLLSLIPLALLVLPVVYFLYITGFVVGNQWISRLLNGPRRQGLFQSHPDCVKGDWPEHEGEKWVFINGVAVGSHWLQSNLDLLAMTFRRPVFGIHNQTRGIIFDVLECIIQRDLSFATTDIRTAYAALQEILSDDNIHKVVLILHSQGGIEGGLVLDWLYDTVAADQLRKLEIYTFGNAANHWNAPVISTSTARSTREAPTTNTSDGVTSQRIVQHIEHYANEGDYVSKFGILHFRPDQAKLMPPTNAVPDGNVSPPPPPTAQPRAFPNRNVSPPPATPTPQPPASRSPTTKTKTQTMKVNAKAATYPSSSATRTPKLRTASTWVPRSHTWTTSPHTPIERRRDLQHAQENNRFFGRLFKRASSGHMLNQHYLGNIFEMEGLDPRDRSRGRVKSGNAFMDQSVDMAVLEQWDTVQAVAEGLSEDRDRDGGGDSGGFVEARASTSASASASPNASIPATNGIQIKQLSRLWGYCNGASPRD